MKAHEATFARGWVSLGVGGGARWAGTEGKAQLAG